jgi:diadenylate cyclase
MIVLAATTLASTKTGALILIERHVGFESIIDAGVKLDAQMSYDLLVSIFNPASPRDAVIVRGPALPQLRVSCRFR